MAGSREKQEANSTDDRNSVQMTGKRASALSPKNRHSRRDMLAYGRVAHLRRDLEQALKEGDLAPATSAGVAIGVFRNGVRRVFAYGAAKPDSIFEVRNIQADRACPTILNQLIRPIRTPTMLSQRD
jgi:hypothetical protein